MKKVGKEESMFLEIHDLKKGFGQGESRVEVLKGISFEVERGEICVFYDSIVSSFDDEF